MIREQQQQKKAFKILSTEEKKNNLNPIFHICMLVSVSLKWQILYWQEGCYSYVQL